MSWLLSPTKHIKLDSKIAFNDHNARGDNGADNDSFNNLLKNKYWQWLLIDANQGLVQPAIDVVGEMIFSQLADKLTSRASNCSGAWDQRLDKSAFNKDLADGIVETLLAA